MASRHAARRAPSAALTGGRWQAGVERLRVDIATARARAASALAEAQELEEVLRRRDILEDTVEVSAPRPGRSRV
jgi:hypothetical protein